MAVVGFAIICTCTHGQSDSCNLRISLLTCSPGEELYSAWGHTAIRVTDSINGSDIVYNYGTFDYEDPLFLANFTKGLMIYSLSAYPYSEFVREYQYYRRGVIEQELRLSCVDKEKIVAALLKNSQEENRHYQYYFHTDNCTTRARDVIVKNSSEITGRSIIDSPAPTYRNLIHVYLNNTQPWSKLGIDILLGANLDARITNQQAQFLPDYLLMGFDSSYVSNAPLVAAKKEILPAPANNGSSVFSPMLAFIMLALLVGGLTLFQSKTAVSVLRVFDFVFFLATGLLGSLLVALWAVRVDDVCRNNFNLAWALPTHAVFAFFLTSRRPWVRNYFRFTAFLGITLVLAWYFLPQQLNNALLPIVLIIILRSWYRSR